MTRNLMNSVDLGGCTVVPLIVVEKKTAAKSTGRFRMQVDGFE